jgi:hypothetical protein
MRDEIGWTLISLVVWVALMILDVWLCSRQDDKEIDDLIKKRRK